MRSGRINPTRERSLPKMGLPAPRLVPQGRLTLGSRVVAARLSYMRETTLFETLFDPPARARAVRRDPPGSQAETLQEMRDSRNTPDPCAAPAEDAVRGTTLQAARRSCYIFRTPSNAALPWVSLSCQSTDDLHCTYDAQTPTSNARRRARWDGIHQDSTRGSTSLVFEQFR